MPTYQNIGKQTYIVKNTNGVDMSVCPGESIETMEVLTVSDLLKISNLPRPIVDGDNISGSVKVFQAETINAGENSIGNFIFDISSQLENNKKLALSVDLTGDGTAKLEYELSPDSVFSETSNVKIVENFTKTSGNAGNGKSYILTRIVDMFTNPSDIGIGERFKYARIKATETGGVDSVTITAAVCF